MELVEERISEEVKNTKGAVLFDGWTNNGIHYIGKYLSYILTNKYGNNPTITLISMSPMAGNQQDEDSDDEGNNETEAV